MNVKELIIELQKCNPEAIVIYDNEEFFEIENLDGKDSDELEIDLFNEPNVPLAHAKSIILY